MRIKFLVQFLAMLAVVALAVPAMAKPVSKSINLAQPAKFGNTQLTVGEYQLLIDGTKVTVQRGKQTLAHAEGRWDARSEKSRYNSVVIRADGQVQEIRFAGDNRVLVISTP